MVVMEICINNQTYTAKKSFFSGMHRLCSPEKTLKNVKSHYNKIGLTRVADITGFDHIGIPVISTIRPNSLTLSVSSGKGVTKEAAIVSGIMEALELYYAETHHFKTFKATSEELGNNAVDFHNLTLRKNAILPKNWPLKWCLGWDLISQSEIAVPLMAVTMNYQLGEKDTFDLDPFLISSNGLASGNHPLEAILSGIYEVIERDAITCFGNNAPKVPLDSIPYSSVKALIKKCERAEVEISLFDSTIDTGAYVFKAETFDNAVGLTQGFGAHLDPEIAMIRALTESVQGRAVFISGARDDIFQHTFQSHRKFRINNQVKKAQAAVRYSDRATLTFEGDIILLLENLKKIGIAQVIVFDLSDKDSPVSVFRVIIPGLEGYHSNKTALGKRAKHSSIDKIFHMPAGGLQ